MSALRNLLIYLLAGAVVAIGGVAVHDRSALAGTGSPEGSVLEPLPPPFAGVERLRIVLMGADDREARGRSDTLMLLQLNPAQGRALILSIPRDLRAQIPGHGVQKINHAYHFGGAKLTRQTVEQLLGVPTDGVIKINIDGFVKAVDILGGVDLEVEDMEGRGRGMNYDCPQDGLVIHLKPGYQHLTGYKAMGYVRYRLSNIPGKGGTDFDRAKRQQKLIKAMIAQKLRVTNLPALYRAGREVYGCVQTNLSWRELLDLARFMRELQPGALKTLTLPGDDARIGGVYYCVLNADEYQQMMAEAESFLRGSGAGDAEPTRVEVLNGSGVAGAAARTADKLKAQGFVVVRVGNAPTAEHEQTTVLYRGDMQAEAERVVKALGAGTVQADSGAGDAPPGTAQVQVTIGRDIAHE
jgi:LCP family protein required for cell wall assembly